MPFNRRLFLAAAASLGAPGLARAQAFDASAMGLRPSVPADQTAAFQRAIDQAAGARVPLFLPPGTYRVGQVTLRPHAQIVGVRGASRLLFQGGTGALIAPKADHVTLTGVAIDGGARPMPEGRGLVHLVNGRGVRVEDCEIVGSSRHGLYLEGVEGEVRANTLAGAGQTGLFALDSRGLGVRHNQVRGCMNNGVQIWRTAKGEDGTIVEGNRIEEIAARAGGSGQNGNAINVYRAGGVSVVNNHVRNCAFSAVRVNGGPNVTVVGNHCASLGEVAIFIEFGFDGAIVAQNLVDGAARGIVATNFNEGGRLAAISGNMVRNLFERLPPGVDKNDPAGVGIMAEADAAITGNVVENAPMAGLLLGWGQFLRDVAATGNVIRQAGVGVGVSVAPGAGSALIADNLVQGARDGAVVGMEWKRRVTGDLTRSGAERHAQLSIAGNRVR